MSSATYQRARRNVQEMMLSSIFCAVRPGFLIILLIVLGKLSGSVRHAEYMEDREEEGALYPPLRGAPWNKFPKREYKAASALTSLVCIPSVPFMGPLRLYNMIRTWKTTEGMQLRTFLSAVFPTFFYRKETRGSTSNYSIPVVSFYFLILSDVMQYKYNLSVLKLLITKFPPVMLYQNLH